MTNNFVYVSKEKTSSKFTWKAEIRSYKEGSNEKPSTFTVKIFKKTLKEDKS